MTSADVPISSDRQALAELVAEKAGPILWCNGLHTVVTLDGASKAWSPGTVYAKRSSAQGQATRLADDLGVLAYVVGRYDDKLTVWAGPDTVLYTGPALREKEATG